MLITILHYTELDISLDKVTYITYYNIILILYYKEWDISLDKVTIAYYNFILHETKYYLR